MVEQFRIYEKNLLEEGKKVENSSLSVNMEENSCVLKGTLTVVEKCGIQKEKNVSNFRRKFLENFSDIC